MRQRAIKISVAIIMFAVLFLTFQRLLMPKHASTILEGGLIREYYASAKDHDILFIGDCEVYANFSPISLWENFGVTSFIRGSPQQLVWQSYYLLQDALRFEQPRVVVFNVLAMQYNEPQHEPYNRLTLDGMRWGMPKVHAISASRTPDEDWISYIFPLFRYKARWREISGEDFRFFFASPRVSVNGFMVRSDVVPATWIPDPVRLGDYAFGDNAMYYLNRIAQLTAAHDIPLVLVKAPSLFPHWHHEWDLQIAAFAQEHGLQYINFLEHTGCIGLDFSLHTFNGGMHLNVAGAEKLSIFFGGILQEEFALPDRRCESATAAYWDELSAMYHRLVARQLEEIAETGRISSFLVE